MLFDVFVKDDGWVLTIFGNSYKTLFMTSCETLESPPTACDVVFGVCCQVPKTQCGTTNKSDCVLLDQLHLPSVVEQSLAE